MSHPFDAQVSARPPDSAPVIEAMHQRRMVPRHVRGRDLVPRHIDEAYQQRWQDEDRALLEAEAERNRGGRLRRAWRALTGK